MWDVGASSWEVSSIMCCGYPFKCSISSKSLLCLSLDSRVEHLWLIRSLSLRMVWSLVRLGSADLWCMKIGFFAFFRNALVRNVVYRITCNECHQSYISSTIRRTHDRIKEHLSRCTSSVYKHFANSHDVENFENRISRTIVARETDPVYLRLKEAFCIRKQKPEINGREECSELTDP